MNFKFRKRPNTIDSGLVRTRKGLPFGLSPCEFTGEDKVSHDKVSERLLPSSLGRRPTLINNYFRPVFNETFPLSLYVHNPPQISNKEEVIDCDLSGYRNLLLQYATFAKMLNELESISGVYGRERTMLWLKEYEVGA